MTLRNMLRKTLLASAFVLLGTTFAAAQQQTGEIYGRATDTSGAVLPGVSVTVAGPSLIQPRVAVTSEAGTYRVPELPMAQRCVVHGDARCTAIAAASIVAKVTRDRAMLELHGRDPRYGFDRHKGYATRDHLDAVSRFGYSDAHRRSFRPPTLFDRI